MTTGPRHPTTSDIRSAPVFLEGRTIAGLRAELFGAGLVERLAWGTIVVERATCTATEARELAADLAAYGLVLLEAPRAGHLAAETGIPPLTLVSGPEAAFEAIRAQFDGPVHYCGPQGKAHALDLFDAGMGISAHIATLETAAMGAAFGLGLEVMGEVVSKGSGRNRASVLALPRMASARPYAAITLGLACERLHLAVRDGQAAGVPMMLTGLALSLAQGALNRYGPQAPLERLADLVESMAGTGLSASAIPTEGGEHVPVLPQSPRIGYLGVGTMGGALARRLMRCRSLMVYDTNPTLTAALAAEGATVAPDAASLARDCDIVFLCLPNSDIVRQAIFGAGGLAEGLVAGKILVDQTTGAPTETRSMARELAARGVTLVDAPVSGGTRGAVAGTIAIIAGGPAPVLRSLTPLLTEISPNLVHCGDTGSGHAAKLVQNAVAACNRVLTLECAAAGLKSGLDLEEMIAVMEAGAGWNGGASRILPALRDGGATTDFAMGLMVKDLRLATEMGGRLGAPLFVANAARAMMQVAANEEGADANLDAIATTVEKLAGLRFCEPARRQVAAAAGEAIREPI